MPKQEIARTTYATGFLCGVDRSGGAGGRRRLARGLMVAVALAALAGTASAQDVFSPSLSFCNRTLTPMYTALAFDRANSSKITTKGWYKVAACTCRTILQNTPLKATEIFLLANHSGYGTVLSNPKGNLCVGKTAFEFVNQNISQQACQAAAGVWSPFKWYDTGGRPYTVNVRRPGECNLMDDTH